MSLQSKSNPKSLTKGIFNTATEVGSAAHIIVMYEYHLSQALLVYNISILMLCFFEPMLT